MPHVAGDYGSVAGELAACLRAVGVADRSDLVKLDVVGAAPDVAAVIGTVAGAVPGAGQAIHVQRAWWSGVDAGRVFVLVDPSHAERLKAALAAAAAEHPVAFEDVSDAWSVLAVLGPRAAALVAPLVDVLPEAGSVVEGALGGAGVVLTRESAEEVLISASPADLPAVSRALHDAGTALGLASVGREAHERFEVAASLRGRRHDHSGW